MVTQDAVRALARVVNESGLVPASSRGVVLVSGGPDSAGLAAGLAELCGRPNIHALHINYRLRDSADADEQTCRGLCAALRIDLRVERPELREGNMQAAAREARYLAAERLRQRTGSDWVATGHTLSDLAETLLYRLAASPGRRAMLGLAARSGRVIRPLLGIDRPTARRLAAEAGLPFADDPTNDDPRFARNRIRSDVVPALREINPAAERNIAETRAELAEEGRLLDELADHLLTEAGAGSGAVAVRVAELAEADPALRRLALRALAERTTGRDVALGRGRAADVWRLARDPEGGEIDLGGGVRAVCEQGLIRFALEPEAVPDPVRLPVPGSCRFGDWEVRAELRGGPVQPAGPELATLDAGMLGEELVVRSWRDGDRIQPLGMHGTKTLQDLFSDRKVPRSLRHRLPVVEAGGRVAWVAGVAVSEEFRLGPASGEVAVLRAKLNE